MKTQTRVKLVWGQRSHISSPDKGPFPTNIRIPHSDQRLVMTQLSIKQSLGVNGPQILLRFTDSSISFTHTLDPRCIKKVKMKLDRYFAGHSTPPEVAITDNAGVAIIAPLGKGESFCESAVLFAKQIFDALGIHDPDNVLLANFHLGQTTYVHVSAISHWVTFSHYLRHALLLPTDVLDVD